jgi:hypothetical protein
MLFLQPPFHIIEGVATMRDHANPLQFYYLPAMPKLSTVPDPVSGLDVPQVQLLKFRGGAGSGGFLTFEVNLEIEPAQRDAIMAELKRVHRLDEQPLLAPVVLEDGTVRLMMLGHASGGEEPSRFVVRIDPPVASKPALYGSNQAVFSAELDQEGVQLVEASLLKGEMMPVGVVYSLDFFALRPAFTVQVTADWHRVQTQLQDSFGFDVLFSSVEIDKVVDKLVEDRVIVINVDSFLPEGEDAGSWVGRRDQAINDFKDMVLDNFFEPSLEPEREEEDGWDRFVHTTERLSLLAATGGLAGVAKFRHVKRDLTRIDTKRLNLVMNERVTVKRSIYPQAALKGLGRRLRELVASGAVDRSRFIQEVDLDDPWFKRREVKAHALVDFDHDDVDSVNLTVNYGGQPQTLRLTKTDASGVRGWNSIVVGDAMRREVEYEYRVNFRNVDTTERPGFRQSPKLVAIGDEFEVSPRAERLYFLDVITFGADALPWHRFPSVSVETRYHDERNDIRLAETFLLTQQKPEATWKRFRLDPERDDYDVRVTYLAADHRDVTVDWRTTNQERCLVRDPRPATRTLQIVPAVPWALVTMVVVDVEYVDAANGVHERQSFSFLNTDQDRLPKTFTAHLVDPEQRFVTYTASILLSDGRLVSIPPSMTAAATVFINPNMRGHRAVLVRPADVNFAALGMLRMEAELTFADEDAGLSFADRFSFPSAKESRFFEYDYVSADRNRYRCRVRTVHANGLVHERDLGDLNGDRLILPAA